jgi:hypothetical protein
MIWTDLVQENLEMELLKRSGSCRRRDRYMLEKSDLDSDNERLYRH